MRNLKLVEEVRHLRDEGWTIKTIGVNLGVPPATVSRWCSDLDRVGKIIEAFQKKRQAFFDMDKIPFPIFGLETIRLLASILYWCEGSKYPASNQLSFTCSDPDLMMLFLKFFRIGFSPDESKFRVWLQIHDVQDKEELLHYWSDRLNIPLNQFLRPHITTRIGGKYRKVYYGTCSLRYYDYSMILRMMGIYSRFYESIAGNGVK